MLKSLSIHLLLLSKCKLILYNFHSLNIKCDISYFFFFSFNTNLSEPVIDDLVSMGSQFSKSPEERENMLRARKQTMIMKARQKYISKEGLPKTD